MKSKCMQEKMSYHFYLNTIYVGELRVELMKNKMDVIMHFLLEFMLNRECFDKELN